MFLRSLNEVHRSFAIGHRILLFLGLADFLSDEPIHVITPIGATFLRQRAAHLKVDPMRPRGSSSSVVPPLPFSTSADAAEASGATAVMLMFLHRLLQKIQTFDIRWIMS